MEFLNENGQKLSKKNTKCTPTLYGDCFNPKSKDKNIEISREEPFSPFPSPNSYSTFANFEKDSKMWQENLEMKTKEAKLPLPISMSVSIPISGPLFTLPNNKKKKIMSEQVNELNEIVLSGSLIEENSKFTVPLRNRSIPISDFFTRDDTWGSKLVPQFPEPKEFDSYEEFKAATKKWHESVKQIIDANKETHPSFFKEELSIPENQCEEHTFIEEKDEKHAEKEEKHETFKFDGKNPDSALMLYLMNDYIKCCSKKNAFEAKAVNTKYSAPEITSFIQFTDILERESEVSVEEKKSAIQYFVLALNENNPFVNSTVVNSIPLLWSILSMLGLFYPIETPVIPIVKNFEIKGNSGLISNALIVYSTYHLTYTINSVLVKNLSSDCFKQQVHFAKEVVTMFSTRFGSDLTKFFSSDITAENVEIATSVILHLLWMNSFQFFQNIFETLERIMTLSEPMFNKISAFVFKNGDAFSFFLAELLAANLTKRIFQSKKMIIFCSEMFSLAKPSPSHDMAMIIPHLSQLCQLIASSSRYELSYMIRCLMSYTRRAIKLNPSIINIVPAGQCFSLLMFCIYTSEISNELRANIIYAVADIVDQKDILQSLEANVKQIEYMICVSAETKETINALWKFIRRIALSKYNILQSFLLLGNISPIIIEQMSASYAVDAVFKTISKIFLRCPKKNSIPQELKCFFELAKIARYNYLNVLKTNLRGEKKLYTRLLTMEINKRPGCVATIKYLQEN